ncbi:divisome-associated lipoprotein DalA [Cochlodiniinecator piscidefendens]|uniref:CAP domain-containing protein n=1 Tax=Cochlodiniinecator piscidefendens TaxID=2715756 RepID=UPI0014095BDD|nr:CAP domain-containing protein [Cochlodiniinecator piscidefendens]
MARFIGLMLILVAGLAACTTTSTVLGPDGQPLQRAYRITNADRVQIRMLDSINSLRFAAGLQGVSLNSQLNAAAATHSLDMSVQNRPWHFGSDGSSPIDRVVRTGYQGRLLGENISETYETELETLAAWMELQDTRGVILDAEAVDMGFSWHQESNGKIWWTLILAAPAQQFALAN